MDNDIVHEAEEQVLAHIEEPPSNDNIEEDEHRDAGYGICNNMDDIEETEEDNDVKQEQVTNRTPINEEIKENYNKNDDVSNDDRPVLVVNDTTHEATKRIMASDWQIR